MFPEEIDEFVRIEFHRRTFIGAKNLTLRILSQRGVEEFAYSLFIENLWVLLLRVVNPIFQQCVIITSVLKKIRHDVVGIELDAAIHRR